MAQNNLRAFPEINGVHYGWAHIEVNIGGLPVVGITKISYSDEQEIANIYGIGARPVGRGYGNITCKASITLLREEIEAIREGSPTGRLQDIAPFDIAVSYIPLQGQKMVNHIIKDCQFKNDGVEVSQGDVKNEQSLELVCSQIKWR